MLTIATACVLKALSEAHASIQIPAVGMWFVAILMDFCLGILALIVLSG